MMEGRSGGWLEEKYWPYVMFAGLGEIAAGWWIVEFLVLVFLKEKIQLRDLQGIKAKGK